MNTLKTSKSEQLVRWIVDADGQSYGDERDRQRYYESNTAATVVMIYFTPWLAAATMLAFGKSAVGPALLMGAMPFVLSIVAMPYLKSQQVNVWENAMKQPISRLLTYAFGWYIVLPCAVLYTLSRDTSSHHVDGGDVLATMAGLLVGGLVAMVATVMMAKRSRARFNAEAGE
jgi:hypothetical protein